jgi:plastocyanin
MKLRRFAIGSLCLLSLFAGACREETPQEKQETWLGTTTDTTGTGTATADATHPGSPGGTAIVPDVDAGTTVLVVVSENSLGVETQSIPAGPAVITVRNGGTALHNLHIEGEGINRAAGDSIAQGGTATLDVVFKPGTYTLYCPILNHRENGEQATITIAQ